MIRYRLIRGELKKPLYPNIVRHEQPTNRCGSFEDVNHLFERRHTLQKTHKASELDIQLMKVNIECAR